LNRNESDSGADPTEREYHINQVYFYLTEGCNLRCRHCWIEPKFQADGVSFPELDFELFRSILLQALPLGLTRIKLTGGEPLIHSRIVDLLTETRRLDIGLTFETNGVLCSPDIAREIASCRNPFVSVSLDGADAETNDWIRGVDGAFEAAVNGIGNLVDAGLKPQIIMTVMRRNRYQLEKLVRLAESLGAGSVKFNVVQPTARGEKMHNRGETLSIEELVELGRWIEGDLSKSASLRIIPYHPAAFRPLGKILGKNAESCNICSIRSVIGVLADGSYALCGIGESVPDLVFGHAAVDPLDDLWHNHTTLEELREGLPQRLEGICRRCLMNTWCLGFCIAQNYYSSRSLWAAHWYCEAAYEQGLFPESRLIPEGLSAVAASTLS